MRHRISGRKLSRDSAHRKALLKNLSISLLEHGVIKTTVAKAKELRRVVEPLITTAKVDTVANRRLVFSRVGHKPTVGKLFGEVAPLYKDRPGGYTRIMKCGFRAGDQAPMAYIELVDRPVLEAVESNDESTVVEEKAATEDKS